MESVSKSDVYNELNKRFKSTCKILLGEEVGELSDYSKWLYEKNGPRLVQKSALSGKEVVLSSDVYSKRASYISFDEAELDKKYPPLSINEIKDIDSIISSVSDRISYSGNIILGNSKFVEQSTTITEGFYIYHTERNAFSKYIAYSTRGGYSEHVFGCYGFGPAHFSIKCGGVWDVTRGFCSSKCDFSSDIYFSHGLTNCYDAIFCFNVRNKRNAIGNLVLPREKYAQLKTKLVAEMREKLKKDKRLPFIFELIAKEKPDYSQLKRVFASAPAFPNEKTDKSRIEKAFSETTGVVLGKPLSPIDKYAKWMSTKSIINTEPGTSCFSGAPLIMPGYAWFMDYPKDRLLEQKEADFAGERLAVLLPEAESLSLQNAARVLSKIAYFCPQWQTGKLQNNIDSPLSIDAVDCYGGILNMQSKYMAFSYSGRNSDYVFGCREPRESSFCINSHFSTKCTRCFEIDHCANCSGVYFCHNCENVHDSMFCFNVKNKKYAIGNVEVGREKFLEAKKILLDYVGKELEAKGELTLDIYNLADFKAKKKEK
ncbi:MAG: hypothetical protein QW568_03020 [Candidatus Anstonellaceae archaeon]